MSQLEMFDGPTDMMHPEEHRVQCAAELELSRRRARNSDPPTSHEAAHAHIGSGANKRHKTAILEILQRQGSATARELSQVTGRYSSRISDLRKDGCNIQAKRNNSGDWVFTLQPTGG